MHCGVPSASQRKPFSLNADSKGTVRLMFAITWDTITTKVEIHRRLTADDVAAFDSRDLRRVASILSERWDWDPQLAMYSWFC